METSYFEKLFSEIRKYVDKGFSVMPVRMEEDQYNGRKLGAKSPLFSFKSKKKETKDLDYLFKIMSYQTVEIGFALCTGSISNNLEIIDIDEKYNPGIRKEYLETIEKNYPELYKKLRIEGTINFGAHIPYCLPENPEGSQDLAKREATEKELKENPKQKHYCFIETRGEDSLCIVPPTKGYHFIQENEIPTLTMNERNILINVAKSYNRVIPKIKKINYSKRGLRNYYVDPWEDYNKDPKNETLLTQFGWKLLDRESNNHYLQFTRPGKNDGISASFIRDKNMFFIFTSNSELEPDQGYNPSTILCELQFGGDTKETFRYLIENGYGQLNERFEKDLIRKAVTNNRELPKNISKKSLEEYKKLKADNDQKYPYGIFWQGDLDDGYSINRELILSVASQMNYKLLEGRLVQLEGVIIKETSQREFEDDLKTYIKEEDESISNAILDKFEAFLQYSIKQTINRLPILEEKNVLRDTRNTAFKAFENGVVIINRKKIKIVEYDYFEDGENTRYILEKAILPRNFELSSEEGLFTQFLEKAILPNQMLKNHIGYMVHGYKDSANAYFHVATEMVEDPKDGGGAGKNIFADLIGRFTTYTEVPGEQIQMDEKFYQQWNGERLMIISDIPKSWNFTFLKNMTSNSAIQKKLYKDVVRIDSSDLPKLLVLTNYSFEITDGGVKRRLMFIEFSDFFTKCGGVDVYFDGKLFPQDWQEEDWLAYDNYMISCLQEYLKNPKLQNPTMSETGWMKKFALNHGTMTRLFIAENINDWVEKEYVPKKEFDDQYNRFCDENGVQKRYMKSGTKMNEALVEWCQKHEIEFEKSIQRNINYVNTSCRRFSHSKLTIDDDQSNATDELPF